MGGCVRYDFLPYPDDASSQEYLRENEEKKRMAKELAPDYARGLASGLAGLPADIVDMVRALADGYSAGMTTPAGMKRGSQEQPAMPFSTDWIGEKVGADVNSPAFIAGSMGLPGFDDAVMALSKFGPEMAAVLFHGSPHKFDKFDMSHLGSGEGAQAYGHGLYFAEDLGLAERYQRTTSFADKKRQFLAELPEDAEIDEVMDLAEIKGVFKDDTVDLLNALAEEDWLGYDYPSQAISAAFEPDALERYDIKGTDLERIINQQGSLYEVDVPDDAIEKMLDWDKPLSEQPWFRDVYEVADEYKQKGKKPDAYAMLISRANDLSGNSGRQFHNGLLSQYGGSQAEVAKWLKEAGIPGIRYLDGTSRRAGEGTSNFVVFDDSTPKILSRNGKPIEE